MRMQLRLHRCHNCGHLMEILTNHAAGCRHYCPECSLEPTWNEDRTVYIPALGEPPRREFECLEDVHPDSRVQSTLEVRKPRPWEPIIGFLRRLQGTA